MSAGLELHVHLHQGSALKFLTSTKRSHRYQLARKVSDSDSLGSKMYLFLPPQGFSVGATGRTKVCAESRKFLREPRRTWLITMLELRYKPNQIFCNGSVFIQHQQQTRGPFPGQLAYVSLAWILCFFSQFSEMLSSKSLRLVWRTY